MDMESPQTMPGGRTNRQERKKPERPAISRIGYCKLNVLLTDREQFIPCFADSVRRAKESIVVVDFVVAAFAADVFKMEDRNHSFIVYLKYVLWKREKSLLAA